MEFQPCMHIYRLEKWHIVEINQGTYVIYAIFGILKLKQLN